MPRAKSDQKADVSEASRSLRGGLAVAGHTEPERTSRSRSEERERDAWALKEAPMAGFVPCGYRAGARGRRCASPRLPGMKVCQLHALKGLDDANAALVADGRGAKAARERLGRYGASLQGALAAHYREELSDPLRRSLEDEVGLLGTVINSAAARLDSLETARGGPEGRLGQVDSQEAAMLRRDLGQLTVARARVSETADRMARRLDPEQARELAQALLNIVLRYVPEADRRAAIGAEVATLLSGSLPQEVRLAPEVERLRALPLALADVQAGEGAGT